MEHRIVRWTFAITALGLVACLLIVVVQAIVVLNAGGLTERTSCWLNDSACGARARGKDGWVLTRLHGTITIGFAELERNRFGPLTTPVPTS